jgi:acetyl-CoA carboxylase alpha subunit
MKKIRLTESELVSLIEKIVKEEQGSLNEETTEVNETVENVTTENKEVDEEANVHEKRNTRNEFINKLYEMKKAWKDCAAAGMYEEQCTHEMARLDEMMGKLGI